MSRGGARPGAGRKAPDGKRVTYTCRVKPETRDTIREMKAEGSSLGRIIDSIALAWKQAKE